MTISSYSSNSRSKARQNENIKLLHTKAPNKFFSYFNFFQNKSDDTNIDDKFLGENVIAFPRANPLEKKAIKILYRDLTSIKTQTENSILSFITVKYQESKFHDSFIARIYNALNAIHDNTLPLNFDFFYTPGLNSSSVEILSDNEKKQIIESAANYFKNNKSLKTQLELAISLYVEIFCNVVQKTFDQQLKDTPLQEVEVLVSGGNSE